MRSAIYYPRTQVHSRDVMQSSLLLWDKLHTIVPHASYRPDYGSDDDMAAAWELIGSQFVPNQAQQQRAHQAIETTLKTGLPSSFYNVGEIDRPSDLYEVWPEKFSYATWELMREHGLTNLPLENGDYPFTQEGGLLVMAKLADACAGTRFARVTDRLMAYGMIGTGDQRSATETGVVPLTLDLIDASNISLDRLIEFRRREEKEGRGGDYTQLRQNYADTVQAHATALSNAQDEFECTEITRQFRDRMAYDLKDLRDALRAGKRELVLKPVVVATIATGGALAAHAALGAALLIGGAAAVGSNVKDIADTIADFLGDRLKFSDTQQELMAKHPMAYMYSLSRTR